MDKIGIISCAILVWLDGVSLRDASLTFVGLTSA